MHNYTNFLAIHIRWELNSEFNSFALKEALQQTHQVSYFPTWRSPPPLAGGKEGGHLDKHCLYGYTIRLLV